MWRRLIHIIESIREFVGNRKLRVIKNQFKGLVKKETFTQRDLGLFLEKTPFTFIETLDLILAVLDKPTPVPLFTREFRYTYRLEVNTPCVESLLSQLHEIEQSIKTKQPMNVIDVPHFSGLLDDWWLTQIETRINTTHLLADLKRLCRSIKQLFAELDVSNQRYYLTFYSQVRRDLMVILVLLLKTKQ